MLYAVIFPLYPHTPNSVLSSSSWLSRCQTCEEVELLYNKRHDTERKPSPLSSGFQHRLRPQFLHPATASCSYLASVWIQYIKSFNLALNIQLQNSFFNISSTRGRATAAEMQALLNLRHFTVITLRNKCYTRKPPAPFKQALYISLLLQNPGYMYYTGSLQFK